MQLHIDDISGATVLTWITHAGSVIGGPETLHVGQQLPLEFARQREKAGHP